MVPDIWTKRHSMTFIIKPTHLCNFRCKYCYITEKENENAILDVVFVKEILSQLKNIKLKNGSLIFTFIWHGGEPLLWGIDNYRDVFSYMKNEFNNNEYRNNIQVNLSLMNDDFIQLFKEFNVHVSFSLDGFEEIHNSHRVDKNGNGTFNTILEKLKLCHMNEMHLGCIAVATKKHIGRIPELYKFMCDYNLGFKFNPIFISGDAKNYENELSITPIEYSNMAIELFDLWFFDEINKNNHTIFTDIASNLITKHITGCIFEKNCQGKFFGITPEGELTPCGRFNSYIEKKYSYGNLHTEKLESLLQNVNESEVFKRHEHIANSYCIVCEFYYACHGGCLHDGFLKSGDFKSKTYLCSAYKKLFIHIKKRLVEAGISINVN